jgi:hypothetical protein
VTVRHETDNQPPLPTDGLDDLEAAASTRELALAGRTPESLVGALFDGLSTDDRDWVVDRINHYRALAAADQAPEGRF